MIRPNSDHLAQEHIAAVEQQNEDQRRKSDADRQQAEKWRSLDDLFEALPNSLDSLIDEQFGNRSSRPFTVPVNEFGYCHLIDDKPVSAKDHRSLCESVLVMLKSIAEWCVQNDIDLAQLTLDERTKLMSEYTGSPAEKSPPWFLLIVQIVAQSPDDPALIDLMVKYGAKLPVKHTMSGLWNRLRSERVASLTQIAQEAARVEDASEARTDSMIPQTATVSTLGDWREYPELGIRYRRGDDERKNLDKGRIQRLSTNDKPDPKSCTLSPGMTNMFEQFLKLERHHCEYEDLVAISKNPDSMRKMLGELKLRIEAVGLVIDGYRLKIRVLTK